MKANMKQTINPDRIRRIQANTVMDQQQIEGEVRRYVRSIAHLAAFNGFGGVEVSREQIMSLALWRRRPAWNTDPDGVYADVLDEIADNTDMAVEPDSNNCHTIRWSQGEVMPLLPVDTVRTALGEPSFTDRSTGHSYRPLPARKEDRV